MTPTYADLTNSGQVGLAVVLLMESGLTEEAARAIFAAGIPAALMRVNTRGGTVEEHQQRVLKDRRACLIEVAGYLFNLRIPPDQNKPKELIKRRVHGQYTLNKYIPGFMAACRERHPEDAAFYAWAAGQMEAICRGQ